MLKISFRHGIITPNKSAYTSNTSKNHSSGGKISMKVLLVNSSPNENGCTFTALSEAAKRLNEHGIETEIFQFGIKPLKFPVNIYFCFDQSWLMTIHNLHSSKSPLSLCLNDTPQKNKCQHSTDKQKRDAIHPFSNLYYFYLSKVNPLELKKPIHRRTYPKIRQVAVHL